ncbi:MAG: DinB family protein [Anaerolineales bacterium]|nr:DinB family protein [Anaerolineales bacterium]
MFLKIGIENGAEGRTIVWELDHLGCFSYGDNSLEALHALPLAVEKHNEWLVQHGLGEQAIPLEQSVHIGETWEVYHIDDNYAFVPDGYEVNAWFQDDWRPLTEAESKLGIELLGLSRADLLSSVAGLSTETLNAKLSGERWSITGILNHVGNADWWYLDRLGLAFPRDELPAESGERLIKIRDHMLAVLPNLVDSTLVVGMDGEFWSPRKVMRRAVWHERDHTAHIQKLLSS